MSISSDTCYTDAQNVKRNLCFYIKKKNLPHLKHMPTYIQQILTETL